MKSEIFILNRPGSPFYWDALYKMWGTELDPKYKDKYMPFEKETEFFACYCLFTKNNMFGKMGGTKKLGESMLEYLIEGDNFAKYLQNKDELYNRVLKLWTSTTQEDIQKKNKDELIQFVSLCQGLLFESWMLDPLSTFVGEIAPEYVDNFISKNNLTETQKKDFLEVVYLYHRLSATIERQKNILERLDSSTNREEVIKKLLVEFAYAKGDMIGSVPFTEKDLLGEYESAKVISFDTEEGISKRNKIFAELKVGETEKKLFDIFAYSGFSKDERRTYQQQLITLCDWALMEIAKQENVPIEHMRFITIDELVSGSIQDPKNELKDRYENGFMIYYNGRHDGGYLKGKAAQDKIDSIKSEEQEEGVKTLKGRGTYAGKVVGKVKLVPTADTVTPDEPFILVTGMTMPDFIHHMHKCAAIVTDEGSIACHAAILSRELKKPCIVGTKFATKMLKDGDIVEVDANTGIVTKL
jgi:phosphohistidine swiveling domain-containing protein